ncbi:MAG TPA: methionine biosynthesis protein MetW, partial [bacterium]|nr:methionine biosynthesis protein MetW [bacterium]
MESETEKLEYRIILEQIVPGSRVLELGCGDGRLLELLVKEKKVKAQGLEIDEQAIYKCVARGLSVLHGDIEQGLSEYQDQVFDYVVMDRTFQELGKPGKAIDEALRVGKKVIVAFPNFVHFKARAQIFFKGRVPVTPALPYEWHDTPNLHFLSISDFIRFCVKREIKIEKQVFIAGVKEISIFPNLFAEIGLFVISRSARQTKG